MMGAIPLDLDLERTATFSKTVAESDVYLFAGITGDLSPNHVNAQAMAATAYGERIAHGVLVLGFASTAATRYIEDAALQAVSYGYDRVRFVRAVRIGDTVTVRYQIVSIDREGARTTARVIAINQEGQTVLAADHVLYFSDES